MARKICSLRSAKNSLINVSKTLESRRAIITCQGNSSRVIYSKVILDSCKTQDQECNFERWEGSLIYERPIRDWWFWWGTVEEWTIGEGQIWEWWFCSRTIEKERCRNDGSGEELIMNDLERKWDLQVLISMKLPAI